MDDEGGGLVLVGIEQRARVIPVADAGIGLPGLGEDSVCLAAFDIQGD